tara:strand:+ start:655 stop:918 length:264 start_codon:yes stop_codon:yes gene_type:complete
MKNLLNKTILRNCKYYKVRRYNSATTYNFTAEELEIFKQKNDITYYFVIKPSRQKAVKIHNLLCDSVALLCFTSALILLIDILLKTL